MGRCEIGASGPSEAYGNKACFSGQSCPEERATKVPSVRHPCRGDGGRWAACPCCPGGERGELDGRTAWPDDRNDGHTVDALALDADEGRGHATKCSGEALAAGDPEISEWGNPAGVMARQPE